MKGYQITFFTQQDRCHGHVPLSDWLVKVALDLGLNGATVVAASEGFGRHHRIHSKHFFELADQPQEIVLAVTEDEAERLFSFLEKQGVTLFYVKTPVEFGVIGRSSQ